MELEGRVIKHDKKNDVIVLPIGGGRPVVVDGTAQYNLVKEDIIELVSYSKLPCR